MGQCQDTSFCSCKDAPICDPPGGDNDGDTIDLLLCAATVANILGGGGDGDGGYVPPPDVISPNTGSEGGITGFGYEEDGEFKFTDIDSSLQYFDEKYNIEIQNNPFILNFADVQSESAPRALFKSSIKATLATLLNSSGGQNFVPYGGTLIGAILFDSQLVENSLNDRLLQELLEVNKYNPTSFNLRQMFMDGILGSVINGTVGSYTFDLFEEIKNSSSEVPTVNNTTKRAEAFRLAQTRAKSLNPHAYENPTSRQIIQRRRIPLGLNETVPIVARSGALTGSRFAVDGLPIVKQDGTIEKVQGQNGFLPIVLYNNSTDYLMLKNDRNKACYLTRSDKSFIEQLLGGTGTTLMASSSASGVEAASGTAIPESMLFSAVLESITELTPPNGDLSRHEVKYRQAWKSGEPVDNFDATVSAWSGPRATVYVEDTDKILEYLTQTDANGDVIITVTFTNLNIIVSQDGAEVTFPPEICTDLRVVPVSNDNKKYVPFAGQSSVLSFSETEGVQRQISLVNTPFNEVAEESYVSTSSTGKSISGKSDIAGFAYIKGYTEGDLTAKLSTNNTTFTTKQSPLGLFLSAVSAIDDNYNTNSVNGKQCPLFDVQSFLSPNDYLQFLRDVPESIRKNIIEGAFSPYVKLFKVALSDIEKTYITKERQTGDSLESLRLQTQTPSESFFPSKYKGKLYP